MSRAKKETAKKPYEPGMRADPENAPRGMIPGCRHLGRVVFGLRGEVLAFLGMPPRSRTARAAEIQVLR